MEFLKNFGEKTDRKKRRFPLLAKQVSPFFVGSQRIIKKFPLLKILEPKVIAIQQMAHEMMKLDENLMTR